MRRAIGWLAIMAACTPSSAPTEVMTGRTAETSAAPADMTSSAEAAPASAGEPSFDRCPIVLDEADRAREWPEIAAPRTAPTITLTPAAKDGSPDARACQRGDTAACLRLARVLHGQQVATHDVYHHAADTLFDRRLAAVPARQGPAPSPTDVAGAVSAFRRVWYGQVIPRLDPADEAVELADCMAGDPFYIVAPIDRRLAHRQTFMLVNSPQEGGEHFLLHGELDDLVGHSDLWMVFYGGTLPDRPAGTSYAAYVDADTGEVVVVTALPEG